MMNIPRYWARASAALDGSPGPGPAVSFGWSFTSQADAERHALERARRFTERLRLLDNDTMNAADDEAWIQLTPVEVRHQVDGVGMFPWDYYGTGRPVREPIIEQHGPDDAPTALITRNRYGARVLNAAEVMFVDLDLPPRPPDTRTFWQRLRGVAPPQAPTGDAIIARVRDVVRAHPDMGMRLYRTANGFRGLITHRTYDPTSDEAIALLEAFGSDPLYIQLCKTQRCFRARLTPKPWRVGMSGPPQNWFPAPASLDGRARFERWLDRYQTASAGHHACHFVEQVGAPFEHGAVAPVVALHDAACVGSDPLA